MTSLLEVALMANPVPSSKLTRFLDRQMDVIIPFALQGYADLGAGCVVVEVVDRASLDQPGRPTGMSLVYAIPALVRKLGLTEEARGHILRKIDTYDPRSDIVVSLIYPGGDLSLRVATRGRTPWADSPATTPVGRA